MLDLFLNVGLQKTAPAVTWSPSASDVIHTTKNHVAHLGAFIRTDGEVCTSMTPPTEAGELMEVMNGSKGVMCPHLAMMGGWWVEESGVVGELELELASPLGQTDR